MELGKLKKIKIKSKIGDVTFRNLIILFLIVNLNFSFGHIFTKKMFLLD